ncbi:MAG: penicillin-binding protein 2 [Gammaproteobacteria bacterium]
MSRHDAIKDLTLEQRVFCNRVLLAGVVATVLLAALLGRMAYLQIVHHDHFTTLSRNNRVRTVAEPPPRGLIYDRNGVVLAENLPSYHLNITPADVDDLDEALKGLSELLSLSDAEIQQFKQSADRKPSFRPTPLRFNLTEDEVARFAVNRHHFTGVEITASLTRHYPLRGVGVHVLGYVARIDEDELARVDTANYSGTTHFGKLGVEGYYEKELHGSAGYRHEEINAQGRALRVLERQPPSPGRDLHLSVDIRLQSAAEMALGDNTGAVVAMDPRSGEVLALASLPTYNPNLFATRISTVQFEALRSNPDRPLFNRALAGQYPPGSTIKPLIGLAGLEYGATSKDRIIYAGGHYSLPNDPRKYRDWRRKGHGRVNLRTSIVQSSDVYFYDLSYRLGIDHIHEFLLHFGLGAPSGLDAVGEAPGLLPSREWKRKTYGTHWYPGETLITGIGQGYMLVTPLQMAAATSTLAMRGRRIRPRFVRGLATVSGARVAAAPEVLGTVELREDSFWDYVIDSMIGVVHRSNGTARRIGYDAPYTIAGKTGTSQLFGLQEDQKYDAEKLSRRLRDHALFIGFAPAEDPRIAVAVIVEHGGGGGSAAAPVARQVMDAYLLRTVYK